MMLLELKDIKKQYFGNQVLKGVSLSLKPGEVHALLGENGAGKSTLMNILFGMPVIRETGGFEGEVILNGEVCNFQSPADAMAKGIGMVHQEFMLLPGFTVAENIKLNREPVRDNLASKVLGPKVKTLNYSTIKQDARKALDTLGLSLNEDTLVGGLPVGYMQFIEIAREIDKSNIKLLVFDEPTAVLAESEAKALLDAITRLSDMGIAVLFITHRLDEVLAVSHNITVLRDGELVTTMPKGQASVESIAELMVGRKVEIKRVDREKQEVETSGNHREVTLALKDFSVNMPGEQVKNLSLEIYKGEILGIGGLAGHGKIGIANGVMGLYPTTGTMIKNGKELPLNDPQQTLQEGIAFVSEDRRGVGLLLDESIQTNIALTSMQVQNKFLLNFPLLKLYNSRLAKVHAEDMIKQLDIRCIGPHQPTRRLSGGNQQKVCIARALTLEPDILFVSEPTRGIDVGAKKIVLDLLVKLNRELGMTVVIVSSELAELRTISDRIAIVCEGQLEGVLSPDAPDADFGLMMSGDYDKKEAVANG